MNCGWNKTLFLFCYDKPIMEDQVTDQKVCQIRPKVIHHLLYPPLSFLACQYFLSVGALTGDSCPSQGAQILVLQGWPC